MIKGFVSMKLGISFVMEFDMGVSFVGLKYCELWDGIGLSYIGFFVYWCVDNENLVFNCFFEMLVECYFFLFFGD